MTKSRSSREFYRTLRAKDNTTLSEDGPDRKSCILKWMQPDAEQDPVTEFDILSSDLSASLRSETSFCKLSEVYTEVMTLFEIPVKPRSRRRGTQYSDNRFTNCALICRSHVEKVPGDGNCGFQAICRAASVYETDSNSFPISSREARELLHCFLLSNREAIEHEASMSHTLRFMLWKDQAHIAEGTQVMSSHKFHEFLSSLLNNNGINGHWLGTCLSAMEAHLLGRALGVRVHIVQIINGRLIETSPPPPWIWNGRMSADCLGAAVIRFSGSPDSGHYEVVRPGRSEDWLDYCASTDVTDEPKLSSYNIGLEHISSARICIINAAKIGQKKSSKVSESLLNNLPEPGSLRQPKARKVEGVLTADQTLTNDLRKWDSRFGVQKSTVIRYKKNHNLINQKMDELRKAGIDPLDDSNGSMVVKELKKILLRRCGPKRKGYENLSAISTGQVFLAAVRQWFKANGKSYADTANCIENSSSVIGPMWKAPSLIDLREVLAKEQAKARSNPIRKVYQPTHDDVAQIFREVVDKQLDQALDGMFKPGTNPAVNWFHFQVTLMIVASFGSGSRGSEMVSLRIDTLRFSRQSVDTDIAAFVYGAKSKTADKSTKLVTFRSWKETSPLSPALAILMQLALVHDLESGSGQTDAPLFPDVINNQVQHGKLMSGDTYSRGVKEIFSQLGITDDATEHSMRRGCAGFKYYVLRETIDHIREDIGWLTTRDTETYIGLSERKNSYVQQGYGTCTSGLR